MESLAIPIETSSKTCEIQGQLHKAAEKQDNKRRLSHAKMDYVRQVDGRRRHPRPFQTPCFQYRRRFRAHNDARDGHALVSKLACLRSCYCCLAALPFANPSLFRVWVSPGPAQNRMLVLYLPNHTPPPKTINHAPSSDPKLQSRG